MPRKQAILCVDIGNSYVKFYRVTDGRVSRVAEHATLAVLSRPKAVIDLVLRACGGVDGAAVSSVVPAVTDPVARVLRRATRSTPLVVRHRLRFPFKLGVGNPKELGVDRLCAAAGSMSPRTRSLIIVDVGSAITVDLVLNRVYRGGYIMAGPAMSLTALGDYASRLPRLSFGAARRVSVPFRSTSESMLAGVTVASAGAIEAAVRQHRSVAGRSVSVALTGGGAPSLRRRLPTSWRYEPHATAAGLFRIYGLNRR